MELDRLIKAETAASLPLTDAQKVAILGVLEDKETAMQALRTSTTDRAAAMQQAQALEQASRTAILAALSGAQQKVYLSLASRRGPGRGGPGQGRPPSQGSGSSSDASQSSNAAPPQDETNIDANTGGGIPPTPASL